MTAHQKFTDTTNAYRAYSRRYLTDIRVQPLRDIFMTYELLAYLSVRATQIGMKACEIPVTRAYPKTGKTPTKISFFKGNSELWKLSAMQGLVFMLVGFVFYGAGALIMIIAYKFGKLSVLQPMLSLNYVLSILLAAFVLREAITLYKVIGVIIITCGVITIAGGDE